MKCPNHSDRIATKTLGYCGECVTFDEKLLTRSLDAHYSLRKNSGLVESIPNDGNLTCQDCGNHCKLKEGEIGFCHNRTATKKEVTRRYGKAVPVSWYFDPLPTNCVADWVCPVTKSHNIDLGPNRLKNLAVFYGSCNSDCIFCQNSSYQDMMRLGSSLMTPKELANAADDKTACVCYFGGDPACNPIHSLKTSEILYTKHQTRVCYETNGNISGKWLDKIAGIVRESGGTMKFDLKAISPNLYRTLTGIKNNTVLKNFKKLASLGKDRVGEFLVSSILLIPGYIGRKEIELLCSFISICDPTIPTALLGFYPHHHMKDLPRTSRQHAYAAREIAIDCGLENVRIGNEGLLSVDSYIFE